MSYQVRQFTPADAPAWDEFVRAHPNGSPFHLTAWKTAIEATFGYRPLYRLAVDAGRIGAVLPLFLARNLRLRRFLVSSPFAVYGGLLAVDEPARQAVKEHLVELAPALGADYLELRNAHAGQALGFSPVTRYVTFHQAIQPDEEALLATIPRKTRRMVRKALDHGLQGRVATCLEPFLTLYADSVRRLGTPCFPRRHFVNLQRAFGEALQIREVLAGDRVVAGVMSFLFRDQVLPYYGASDPRFHELAPNNFMYFDLMRTAAAAGARLFDFGRSKKDTGAFEFKSHWGMQVHELPYEMLLAGGGAPPDFTPKNPRLQWALRAWQRVPLPLARLIGPALIRFVP